MPGYEKTTDKNPNADVRHRLNSPFATQKEREEARTEQKRRETSEMKMRAASSPDAAINKEKKMPSELRKEGYSNERLNIILETIEAILMEGRITTKERLTGGKGYSHPRRENPKREMSPSRKPVDKGVGKGGKK